MTPRTVIFIISFATLALVHLVALELFLYWHYAWLDVPVHFLGGAVVALGAYGAHDLRLPFGRHLARSLYSVLAFVIVAMVTWEIFEVWAGIPIEDNFVFDTSIDIIAGFLGGITGALLGRRLGTL